MTVANARPGFKKRNRAKRSLRDLWRWNFRLWVLLTVFTLAGTLLAGYFESDLLAGALFGCLFSAIYAAVLLLPLWLQNAGGDTRQPPAHESKSKQRAPKKK